MRRARPFVLFSLLAASALPVFAAEPKLATPELAAAHAHYTAREDAEAKMAFAAILAKDPTNAAAEYYLGRIAKRQKDWETVTTHYARCTELEPANALYWADLGEAYGKLAGKASVFRQLGLARKCRTALEKAVELAPDDIEFRRGLAEFYEKAPGIAGGGHGKALAQAEAIRQLDPFAGAMTTGSIEAHAKNWPQAEAALLEAAAIRPDSVEPHLGLGELRLRRGDKAGARTAFASVLRIAPGHPRASEALARLGAE